MRHGIKEFCARGKWPATDYAEFFKCFGLPREVLLVTNGSIRWSGGFSKFDSWRDIKLMATELALSDQKNLIEFLKAQLPSSIAEDGTEFTVVDALKEHLTWLACPYRCTEWKDMTEKYMWV